MCEGAGETAGPEEGAGAAESAGGVQEHPLSAAGAETTPAEWGKIPWQQEVS